MKHEPSFKFSLAHTGALRYNAIRLTTRADQETIVSISCDDALIQVLLLFCSLFSPNLSYCEHFLSLLVFNCLIVRILVIVCISLSFCEYICCVSFISLWVRWPLKKPYWPYPWVSLQMLLFCLLFFDVCCKCIFESHDGIIFLVVLLLYKIHHLTLWL